jgi:hypothetical protein
MQLILRKANSPFGDITKNSVLSQEELDLNQIKLKGEIIYTADTENNTIVLKKINGNEIIIPVNTTPTLQQVLDFNHDLVDGIFNAGTGAGSGNTQNFQIAIGDEAGFQNSGINQIAIGEEAGFQNSGSTQNAIGRRAGEGNSGNRQNAIGERVGLRNLGDYQNAIGYDAGIDNTGISQVAIGTGAGDSNSGDNQVAIGGSAGDSNSGDNQVAIGLETGIDNTGDNVNAFGYGAGFENAFNNVNLFGENAQADENGQTVLSKDGTIMARISTTGLTDTRKYVLPDENGKLATREWVLNNKSFINYFEFSGNAVTTIVASDTWYKLATSGTTSLFSRNDLVHTNNRVTNTGDTKVFKIEGIISISAGNNQEIHAAFFKNDNLYPCSEQTILLSGTGKSSALPFHCLVELEQNDYIEVWVKNATGTTNITLSNVNVIITEM